MDPVSLSLAIAPLCLSAVVGAKYARKKLRLLRGYKDKQASRLRKRLKTQISLFLDECQLLLQDVDDHAAELLEDPSSTEWSSADLDNRLRKHLGKKHDEVKEVIEQIKTLIKSIDYELSVLDQDHSDRSKVRSPNHHVAPARLTSQALCDSPQSPRRSKRSPEQVRTRSSRRRAGRINR